jgi:hypothetical protein
MTRKLGYAALVGMAGLAIATGGEQAGTIPLESVYSTSQQPGLKHVTHAMKADGNRWVPLEPYGHFLQRIRSDFSSGLTNVFLVRGKDITQAVRATSMAMPGNSGGGYPVLPEDGSEPTQLWLVAYLGRSSSGTDAEVPIQSVEREGKTIRLAYRYHRNANQDMMPYIFWVPLGEMKKGTYTLELFDTDKKEVTLLRRVTW